MSDDTEEISQNAIGWAKQHLGSSAYATRCLAFVEDSIERANGIEVFGGDYAGESARLYGAGQYPGEPTPGALVFYDTAGELFGSRQNWGHVGLALGGGEVIHAWDKVRVDDYRSLASLSPAAGWESLRLVGWVPLARVLEGSQAREWSTDAVSAALQQQTDRFAAS